MKTEEIAGDTLSKVILSLNMKRDVYKNKDVIDMFHAPKSFNENSEMGISGWVSNPAANVTSWKDLPPLLFKAPTTGDGNWVDFEIPVEDWKKIVNGEMANNGFLFDQPADPHCTYQEYYSSECDDKTLAPKMLMIYGVDAVNSSFVQKELSSFSVSFANNIIALDIQNSFAGNKSDIIISDLRGREIVSMETGALNVGRNKISIAKQLSTLSQGVYIATISFGIKTINLRISK